jgi:diguanylate cyclase (GGDEF)-like protein
MYKVSMTKQDSVSWYRRMLTHTVGLLLACFATLSLAAGDTGEYLDNRTLLFSRISHESGLVEAPINAITQDRQGYVWFGSQEGLHRYDGYDIEIYEHRFDEPRSLSSDWIWALTVDRTGDLWVGTEDGGLNRYNHETDDFTHYQHDPDNPNSLSHDRVRAVFQDRQGTLWVGTDGGGLNRFDAESGDFTHYRHDTGVTGSLPHDTVLAIQEDRSGNLWVGTNGGGLSRLDRKTETFTHFQHDANTSGSISDNHVRAIHEDREGRLWIATYKGGLNLFNPDTGGFKHYKHDPEDPNSLSDNRVRNVYQDLAGTIWVATDSGLNEWRPEHQGFASYVHSPTDSSTISDNRTTALFQDRGGVLWVGTYNGLNKWNYLSDAFTYYQQYGSNLRISNDIVTSLAQSRNSELWVGTYGGGLNRINLADSSVRQYLQPQKGDTSVTDARVMALNVGADDSVWIGTRKSGLSRLNPDTGELTHYRHDPGNPLSLSSNGVTSILAEASGQVWVGTYGQGLNRLDASTGQVKTFRSIPGDSSSISSDRVLAVYRDRAGTLWIGTEDGGLNRYDDGNETFSSYQHNENDPDSLSNNGAWVIHETSDRSLWVGTKGGGLNRWRAIDREAGRAIFRKFRKGKGDGLHSDTIQGILEDNAGFLWLSSNRGLDQLDPSTGTVRHFNRNSGLKANEFNFAANLRSRSGRLLFGGNIGLLAFYPSKIGTNRHQPDIVLSAHNRNGPMDTRYSSIPDDSELVLDYSNDLISFDFTGLDFSAPERNRYRYRLEGFDQGWSEQQDFKRATYTNLPAGNYIFQVQASNNDGVWNELGVSVPLRVIPPPWQTAWAYAGYVLLAILAVYAFIRLQNRKLARETEQRLELEEQVQTRTQELATRNRELLSVNDQLKESSWTDSLTGLKNRRFLDEFIEAEVAQAHRQTRDMDLPQSMVDSLDIAPALSFMMIDLDGFKAINDNYGHHAGDEALLQVRDILRKCCRKSDTIIRWGGDEFLIVSRNTSNRAAEKLAERIRVMLAEHVFSLGAGHVSRLSGSIGFAVYPFSPLTPDMVSWEQVSAIADQCAYVAKENGRNAWVGIYGNKTTSEEDVAQMKTDLEGVIRRGAVGLRTSIYGDLLLSEKMQESSQ